jgi:hypothetical protein
LPTSLPTFRLHRAPRDICLGRSNRPRGPPPPRFLCPVGPQRGVPERLLHPALLSTHCCIFCCSIGGVPSISAARPVADCLVSASGVVQALARRASSLLMWRYMSWPWLGLWSSASDISASACLSSRSQPRLHTYHATANTIAAASAIKSVIPCPAVRSNIVALLQ